MSGQIARQNAKHQAEVQHGRVAPDRQPSPTKEYASHLTIPRNAISKPPTMAMSATLNTGHQPRSMKFVTYRRRRMSSKLPAAPPRAAPTPVLVIMLCNPTPEWVIHAAESSAANQTTMKAVRDPGLSYSRWQ